MDTTDLKVTDVRYFRTRRGTGYECTTNKKGVVIWNDGDGSNTFINPNGKHTMPYNHMRETELESLIDQHEQENISA